MDRPHSSWRAIVYTKEQPQKLFHGKRNLPSRIVPDQEIMKQEICDPDHIPAHIVQLTEKEQYVYIEGDVCEILGTEVHMADGHNDPYLKSGQKPAPQKKKSSLILPGQSKVKNPQSTIGQIITTSAQAASLGAGGPIDLSDTWIVDLNFKSHPVSDAALCDKVKMVAWNYGLRL